MLAISLFDKSGLMLEPWARAGYRCINVDWHNKPRRREFDGGGVMEWVNADVRHFELRAFRPDFISSFPDCTDLTRAGAKHWEGKAAIDPDFQQKAIDLVEFTYEASLVSGAPFVMENPPGRLSTEWRPPHDIFSPHEYGLLCPPGPHPLYPRYIPQNDAYTKPTCVWFGNGFVMPEKCPVEPVVGTANSFKLLGGKTLMVKDIRSATPRGFAEAVFRANCPLYGLT